VSFNLTADQSLDVLAALDPSATDAINLGGNALRQEIYGNAGDNILNGLGGDDLLAGGGGNDTYYISSGTETIVEGAGGGHDVVYTPMSYALAAGAQIEAISTTSIVDTTAINLAGNEFAQEIYGNNGANILQGRGGADLLAGYGGDDTYYVVDGGERIVENVGGGGSDTVYASVNYALTAGSEVEALSAVDPSATAAINLTGNELGQGLYGNAGANILNGLDGNDYLLGGAGADSFQFTTTLGAGNVDRIGDFVSGTDKIVLDDAVFSGLGLGSLPASVFHVGASATDEDQRIVYDDA
jgi:Ca2+-binding RTX toxin-like protein